MRLCPEQNFSWYHGMCRKIIKIMSWCPQEEFLIYHYSHWLFAESPKYSYFRWMPHFPISKVLFPILTRMSSTLFAQTRIFFLNIRLCVSNSSDERLKFPLGFFHPLIQRANFCKKKFKNGPGIVDPVQPR